MPTDAELRREAEGGDIHNLKCWPEPFCDMREGRKLFEYRKHDRDFRIGDLLWLEEWDPATEKATGDFDRYRVTYILRGGVFGIPEGYCVMGVEPWVATARPGRYIRCSRLADVVRARLRSLSEDRRSGRSTSATEELEGILRILEGEDAVSASRRGAPAAGLLRRPEEATPEHPTERWFWNLVTERRARVLAKLVRLWEASRVFVFSEEGTTSQENLRAAVQALEDTGP